MGLPKIKQPEYKHFLYGINKEITFRPFTNAEQKILLLAKEEAKEDKTRIIDSVHQILKNCIVDKDIDIDQMPMFDIEDLFLRIRSKSVGEKIQTRFSYDYEDENGASKTDFVKKSINIDDIKLHVKEEHSKDIIVDKTNNIGIRMKYPTLADMREVGDKDFSDFDIIKKCIEFIYDESDIYHLADYSQEEMDEFMDSIGTDGMLKINQFFDNIPSITHTMKIVLPKLNNKEETVTLKGIKDFFI